MSMNIKVSEELSSVETKLLLQFSWKDKEFQKNLVVWKHDRIKREGKDNTEVSEELSSVETYQITLHTESNLSFQKNLVVWKHTDVHISTSGIYTFQKNLVVWKRHIYCYWIIPPP